MNVKVKNLKLKLLITIVYIALIVLMRLLGITCIYKFLFDVPCPGCGMTRACIAAMRLDFCEAFAYNPMFWSVPILYLYFLCDGALFKNKIINLGVMITMLAGIVINWIVQLFFYA